MTPLQIAETFSSGNFALVYPYLTENVEWYIPGQEHIKGKQAVIDKCEQTARYFDSVQPRFIIKFKIVEQNKVVITGKAEWKNAGGSTTYMEACDLYVFEHNKLRQIISYCVPAPSF